MKYSPVIVVVAFNRLHSLERILSSLKNVKKADGARLIISIDNQEPGNYPVRDLAMAFEWPHGEKEVIYQPRNLGLRKHILLCGDLSQKYGSVIILEDDLYLSPYFYDYTLQALEYYGDDEKIGGISLFNHTYEDLTEMPFAPIVDESDVYFMQFPSSYGQAWTSKQWQNFKKWYDKGPDISKIRISPQVLSWRESSWKKYFNAYLVESNTFFVFPRVSLTTNFNDQGTHKVLPITYVAQAPLQLADCRYRFKPVSESNCLYDAHFELTEKCVKFFRPDLQDYSFEMDLYGKKELEKLTVPFVITSRYPTEYKMAYQRSLKPHDMNVICNLPGDELFFCRKEHVQPARNRIKRQLSDYQYYYSNHVYGMKVKFYHKFSKYKFLSCFFEQ